MPTRVRISSETMHKPAKSEPKDVVPIHPFTITITSYNLYT